MSETFKVLFVVLILIIFVLVILFYYSLKSLL